MFRPCLFTVAMAIGITSCAKPAGNNHSPAPAVKKVTASVRDTQEKKVKKTPRMNGRGKVSSISITDLFALQQSGNVIIYDARPGFFHGLGHIPGAISFPKGNVDEMIAKHEAEIKAAIASKKTIVVYCTNLLCPDARTVANHLASEGASSSTLTGGWESWKEAGLPTE